MQSIDVDDYTIDKDLNVTLLKTKDRYNNLPAEIKEQEVEVANRFELWNHKTIFMVFFIYDVDIHQVLI